MDASGITNAGIIIGTKANCVPGWFMNPDSGQFALSDYQINTNNINFPISIKKSVTNRFYLEWTASAPADYIGTGNFGFVGGITSLSGSINGTSSYNNLWSSYYNNIRGTIFHCVGSIAQSTYSIQGYVATMPHAYRPYITSLDVDGFGLTSLRLYGAHVSTGIVASWAGGGGGSGDYIYYTRIRSTNIFKTGANSRAGPAIITVVVNTAAKSYITSLAEFDANYIQIYENGIKLTIQASTFAFKPFYVNVTSTTDRPCSYGYNLCGNFKINVPLIESAGNKGIQSLTTTQRGYAQQGMYTSNMPNTPLSYYAQTTETMDDRGFTQAEVDASMANMMNRWGIVKAFRYMRFTNIAGTSDLFVSRFGLFSTKSAAKTGAISESCLSQNGRPHLGAAERYGVLGGITLTNEFTSLNANDYVGLFNSASAFSSIPFRRADGLPTIIDLEELCAPSYIRFGPMGTGSTTTHRLKLELSTDNITWVEHEMRYYDSSNTLRNTRDDQFILSFNSGDANKIGTYNCATGDDGIFLIYNPAWDTEENLSNDGLLLGVSSINSNNIISGSNVTTLANSTNIYTLAPTVTMTANGTLSLVANAFGPGKKGILTRWVAGNTGMFSTTTSLTLGGSSDGAGVEFTIYFLGRGATVNNSSAVGLFSFGLSTATARNANYQAELTRNLVDVINSTATPGALSTVIGGTTWLGQIGNRDATTYPTDQYTFEVWCVTKMPGVDSAQVYLNNQLLSTISPPLWSSNSATWAKRASGYWQLGDGATSADRTSGTSTGTYIGAFQVYNKYHNYSARCGILRSLMTTFYIPPTASSEV
jgi:hypothetical protein